MKIEYNKKFNSNIFTAKEIISEFLSSIDGVINKDQIFDVKVILNELIINGIVHGNMNDEKKLINLNINLDSTIIDINVEDEGNGFNFDRQLAYEEMGTCGRGLLIVDGITDNICVTGSSVNVKKKLK